MGAQELAMARVGSVTLQKAAQIIEYERSVKSTVVNTDADDGDRGNTAILVRTSRRED